MLADSRTIEVIATFIYLFIFSSIDLYRNDLLLILSRMVCFYRAEAYHVAGFSAVNTAVRTLVTGPSVGRPSAPMPVGGTYGTYHPALMKTSEGAYLGPSTSLLYT